MAQTLCQLKKKGGGGGDNISIIDTIITSAGVTFTPPTGTHFMVFTAFSYGTSSSGELFSVVFNDDGTIKGQNANYLTANNVSNKAITVIRSSNKTAYVAFAVNND